MREGRFRVWLGLLALAALFALPSGAGGGTAWASHGGPTSFVDIASPPGEDADGDRHFRTVLGALEGPPRPGEYDTVLVEPGRYEGDLTIDVEGLTLRSARGPAQTVLAGRVILRARNVRLEGFSIEGRPGEAAVLIAPGADGVVLVNNRIYGAALGVVLEDVGEARLEKNQIYNHARDGLTVRRGWSVTLVGNELRGNGSSGAWIEDSQDLVLGGNEIAFNRLGGLWLKGAQRAQIAENTIHDNDLVGLVLQGSSDSRIEENRVSSNDAGILLIGSVGNEVASNEVVGQRVVGIGLKNGAQGNVIEENLVRGNQGRGAVGLRLAGSVSNNEFRKNRVVENGTGVLLTANETGGPLNNLFAANEITRSDGVGARIEAGAARNEFSDNEISQNLDEGIVSAGDSDVYRDNEIHENGRAGLALRGARDVRAEKNRLYANGGEGVLLEEGSGVVLTGNEITENVREGLSVGRSERIRLLGNEIARNGGHGLLAQETRILTLSGNTVSANSEAGALITGVEHLVVEGNTIEGNGAGGVRLEGVRRGDFEANRVAGNLHFGLRVVESEGISARRNFWGDIGGPAGAFTGAGNAVLGLAPEDVTPWLPAAPDELVLSSLSALTLDSPRGSRIEFDASDRLGLVLTIYNPGRGAAGRTDLLPESVILAGRYASRPEGIHPLDFELGFYAIAVEGIDAGTAELTLFYREEDEPPGLNPTKLRIFVWEADERGGRWVPLPGRADPTLQRVTGEIPVGELSGKLIALGVLESVESESEPVEESRQSEPQKELVPPAVGPPSSHDGGDGNASGAGAWLLPLLALPLALALSLILMPPIGALRRWRRTLSLFLKANLG